MFSAILCDRRTLPRRTPENGGNAGPARAAGAWVEVFESDDPIESIVQYARSHGITQIFVGHSMKKDWRARLWGTAVSRLIRAAEGMDVRVFPH